jgi:hypothetical protein
MVSFPFEIRGWRLVNMVLIFGSASAVCLTFSSFARSWPAHENFHAHKLSLETKKIDHLPSQKRHPADEALLAFDVGIFTTRGARERRTRFNTARFRFRQVEDIKG